jgi:hypothetical protein
MTPRHSGGPSAQPLGRRLAFRPRVLPLEDRSLPSVTNPLEPGTATDEAPPATDPAPPPPPATVAAPYVAVGAEAGKPPVVNVYDTATGQLKFSFMAYDPSYDGGVRVATGDVSGDGVPDIVTAAGPGSLPLVKVFDGKTGVELKRFLAYDPKFTGGVYVAVGDVNGDGHADIITGAGETGGPHVRVWNGAWAVPPIVIQNQPPTNTTPDPTTTPSDPSNPTSPSDPSNPTPPSDPSNPTSPSDPSNPTPPSDPPPVTPPDTPPTQAPAPQAIDSTTELITEFMAYDPSFRGGVRVASADVNNDGFADIITAAGPGGGPHVRVWNGVDYQLGAQWMAYPSAFTGGVYVSAGDLDGDGKAEVVTGAGPRGGTLVRVYNGNTGQLVRDFTVGQIGTIASVRVDVVDFDQDGRNDILTSLGSVIQVRDGQTFAIKETFNPFDPGYLAAVNMG